MKLANREPNSYNYLGAFHVKCFARVCEIFTTVVSKLQRGPHVVLKSLCRHACYIGHRCSVFAFLTQIRKNRCDVILIKNVGHVFCQIFQLRQFRLVCLWQLIILFSPAK